MRVVKEHTLLFLLLPILLFTQCSKELGEMVPTDIDKAIYSDKEIEFSWLYQDPALEDAIDIFSSRNSNALLILYPTTLTAINAINGNKMWQVPNYYEFPKIIYTDDNIYVAKYGYITNPYGAKFLSRVDSESGAMKDYIFTDSMGNNLLFNSGIISDNTYYFIVEAWEYYPDRNLLLLYSLDLTSGDIRRLASLNQAGTYFGRRLQLTINSTSNEIYLYTSRRNSPTLPQTVLYQWSPGDTTFHELYAEEKNVDFVGLKIWQDNLLLINTYSLQLFDLSEKKTIWEKAYHDYRIKFSDKTIIKDGILYNYHSLPVKISMTDGKLLTKSEFWKDFSASGVFGKSLDYFVTYTYKHHHENGSIHIFSLSKLQKLISSSSSLAYLRIKHYYYIAPSEQIILVGIDGEVDKISAYKWPQSLN